LVSAYYRHWWGSSSSSIEIIPLRAPTTIQVQPDLYYLPIPYIAAELYLKHHLTDGERANNTRTGFTPHC